MQVNTTRQGVRAEINVTPMIDVLLVLLIVFMAIAPTRSQGLETSVPQMPANQQQVEPDNPIVLDIASDGSYRLNSQAVSRSSLADRLIQIFERRADRVLFVKAAPALEFQVVAEAIDTARGVNIDKVALMR